MHTTFEVFEVCCLVLFRFLFFAGFYWSPVSKTTLLGSSLSAPVIDSTTGCTQGSPLVSHPFYTCFFLLLPHLLAFWSSVFYFIVIHTNIFYCDHTIQCIPFPLYTRIFLLKWIVFQSNLKKKIFNFGTIHDCVNDITTWK